MQNPQAYIAVRKSRLRTEDGIVYLEKDTEFEIELYNPTTGKIGVQITLDGKKQLATLILRPGEKIFLDRYLDDNRKYKFDTYIVDGSNETKNAITNNGGLKIEFFREVTPAPQVTPNYSPNYPYHYPWNRRTNDPWFEVNYSTSAARGFTNYSSDVVGSVSNHNLRSNLDFNTLNANYDASIGKGMEFADFSSELTPISKSIETGIVEKGSVSDQELHNTNIDLNPISFHTVNLKLMPVSQRPAEAALYCVECGRRARKKEKFCPMCGSKHNWNDR